MGVAAASTGDGCGGNGGGGGGGGGDGGRRRGTTTATSECMDKNHVWIGAILSRPLAFSFLLISQIKSKAKQSNSVQSLRSCRLVGRRSVYRAVKPCLCSRDGAPDAVGPASCSS